MWVLPAISPRTRGTWIQSLSRRASFFWLDRLCWSAISRNISEHGKVNSLPGLKRRVEWDFESLVFLFFFLKITRPDSQHSVISLKNSFVANYENEKENMNDVLLIHKVNTMFDILSHSRFKRAAEVIIDPGLLRIHFQCRANRVSKIEDRVYWHGAHWNSARIKTLRTLQIPRSKLT